MNKLFSVNISERIAIKKRVEHGKYTCYSSLSLLFYFVWEWNKVNVPEPNKICMLKTKKLKNEIIMIELVSIIK